MEVDLEENTHSFFQNIKKNYESLYKDAKKHVDDIYVPNEIFYILKKDLNDPKGLIEKFIFFQEI